MDDGKYVVGILTSNESRTRRKGVGSRQIVSAQIAILFIFILETSQHQRMDRKGDFSPPRKTYALN